MITFLAELMWNRGKYTVFYKSQTSKMISASLYEPTKNKNKNKNWNLTGPFFLVLNQSYSNFDFLEEKKWPVNSGPKLTCASSFDNEQQKQY